MLPIRPKPIQGEAIIGYLMRVADANGYESPRQLWHSLKSWDNLVDALGLAECEIQNLFGCLPSYWGEQKATIQGLSISDFNHYQLRWCPLCLMDSNHVRGIWLLKLCCVCKEHKIILHDKCPGCGSPQGLLRPKLDRCQCGTRLTSGNIEAASLNLINSTHALELGINGLIQRWIKLALYLGQFTEKFQPAKPGQVSNLHQLEVSLGLMSNIVYLLDRWPENFYKLLQAIQQKNNRSASLRKTFGKLLNVLYRQLDEPFFQFLRDAFENYLKLHWEGLLCRRHRLLKPETVSTHPQLTLKQTAKLAGSSPTMVRQLIQAEIISSFQGQSSKRRLNCAINRHQVRRIAELTKNNVNLQEAAKSLNLPERRVRLLMTTGIISPLVSREQLKAASWRIHRKQLAKLWLKSELIASPEQVVKLATILKNWRLTDDEFIKLINALMVKELIPVADQQKLFPLGKVQLIKDQFLQWLSGQRAELISGISVDAAARQLGLKQEVGYGLVKNGFLQSSFVTYKGYRVSPGQIAEFQQTYMSLAEIVKMMGKSSKKLLIELEAVPVTGPNIDGTRQYFYRRDSVTPLIQ
jgi:DNA-binding transcriptional MerR regulator